MELGEVRVHITSGFSHDNKPILNVEVNTCMSKGAWIGMSVEYEDEVGDRHSYDEDGHARDDGSVIFEVPVESDLHPKVLKVSTLFCSKPLEMPVPEFKA